MNAVAPAALMQKKMRPVLVPLPGRQQVPRPVLSLRASVRCAFCRVPHDGVAGDVDYPPDQQAQFLQPPCLPPQPLRLVQEPQPPRLRRCLRSRLRAARRPAETPLPFAEVLRPAVVAPLQSMPAATARAGSRPPRQTSCAASIDLSSICACRACNILTRVPAILIGGTHWPVSRASLRPWRRKALNRKARRDSQWARSEADEMVKLQPRWRQCRSRTNFPARNTSL